MQLKYCKHNEKRGPAMKARKAFYLAVCCLLPVFLFLSVSCSCGDDDDDDEDGAEEAIAEVIREMTEGWMERTDIAFEAKVFPHISENYDYTGFDKTAYEQDALEGLEENPWLVVDKYDLTILDIDVDGDTAVSRTSNLVQATMQAHDSIEFDASYAGEFGGVMHFAYEEDGEWRMVAGEAVYTEWSIRGGEEDYAVDDLEAAVNVQEIHPDGSVTLTGTATLPAISNEETLAAVFSMSWFDERHNAQHWWDANESRYEVELTDQAGGVYEFEVTLPGDGEPAGIAIPSSLPLGFDSLQASVVLITGDDDRTRRVDGLSFALPFSPLENVEPCAEAPAADPDGLWSLTLVDDTYGVFDLFMVMDLRMVGQDLYGSILFVTQDEYGTYMVAGQEPTGSVDGDQITFGFETPEIAITYEATLEGAEMIEGVFTYDPAGPEEYLAEFTGIKLDNRCESLDLEELDGTLLNISAGSSWTLPVEANEAAIVLSSEAATFSGYMIRNILAVIDDDQSGNWILAAFYNEQGGWAAMMEDGVLTEGLVGVTELAVE